MALVTYDSDDSEPDSAGGVPFFFAPAGLGAVAAGAGAPEEQASPPAPPPSHRDHPRAAPDGDPPAKITRRSRKNADSDDDDGDGAWVLPRVDVLFRDADVKAPSFLQQPGMPFHRRFVAEALDAREVVEDAEADLQALKARNARRAAAAPGQQQQQLVDQCRGTFLANAAAAAAIGAASAMSAYAEVPSSAPGSRAPKNGSFGDAAKKAPKEPTNLSFHQREKRKRDAGQSSRGKAFVEEEKRLLRQNEEGGAGYGFD